MAEKSVLVIDDDASLGRIIEFFLKERGYRVFTTDSGEEGLQIFSDQSPRLVITDLQMPGMNGLDVLREIREKGPETLVIVITAHGTVETAVQAMKLGAYDYLAKPFGREELSLMVEKAFAFLGLREENCILRSRLSLETFPSIIAQSKKMHGVVALAKRVATSESTVLVYGESGTGKEVIARAIHQGSDRKSGEFVAVNCAAIPRELLESELFGHVKGAFSGAVRDRQGKFEKAHGGTLFLDEIGELPLDLQPKLLRALQEREIEPVGGQTKKVDVRVVAATNRDLEEAMARGHFREDLYYRLAVVPVHIPPLRARRDDIRPLVEFFLKKHGNGVGRSFHPEAMKRLETYDWPGNVRELENTVERLLVLVHARVIEEADLPPRIRANQQLRARRIISLPEEGCSLEDIEKEIILESLLRHDWNQSRAAAFLRVPRHVLAYRVEKYGITQ